MSKRTCRNCGCTDDDCRQCIKKTGSPCTWVEADLCSACLDITTHYFLHTGYCNSLQNKRDREVYSYLKSLSGCIVIAADFEVVKKMILDEIQTLNELHKRCKPLNCSWEDFRNDSDRIRLYGFYDANFYIYKAKACFITKS